MKIYLDLVLFLNFSFDFLLLLGVSVLLRRVVPIYKVLLGAFIGSLSILLLFFEMSSLTLFLLKVAISIIMILTTFGYRDLRYTFKNLFYLYTSSMILGGFLYFLNVEFSYRQVGLIFYHHGLSVNVLVLIILSPIIIYTYVRQGLKLKNYYANYYEVVLYFGDYNPIRVSAFLDTGNRLFDPYFNRPVILVNKNKLPDFLNDFKKIYVPYETISGTSLLTCVIPRKVDIKGVEVKGECLVGLLEEKISIEGVDCILHTKLLEG